MSALSVGLDLSESLGGPTMAGKSEKRYLYLTCFADFFSCTCRTETDDTSLDSSCKGLSFDMPYGLIGHRVGAQLCIEFEAK